MKKIFSRIARSKWDISQVEGAVVVKMNSNTKNYINEDFFVDFHEAMDTLEKDYPKVPLVLTSANEGIFSKGMDVNLIKQLCEEEKAKEICKKMNDMFERLYLTERPAIAAINGKAIGGGFILSLCCDFRFISPEYFLETYSPTLGISYPSMVYHVMKYEIPWYKKFMLLGDLIEGDTAIRERISLKNKFGPLQDSLHFINDDIKCSTTFTANKMSLKKQNLKLFQENEATHIDDLFVTSAQTEESKKLVQEYIDRCGCGCMIDACPHV